jgi:hypothetical protein
MLISMWRYNWFNPRTTQYQKICMTKDMCYISLSMQVAWEVSAAKNSHTWVLKGTLELY